MTRQAFLAQMPDPLSLRLSSSSLSLSPCRSTSRVFSFSPLAPSPSFLLFLSPFTVVPSLRCVCLFPSDDSLSYFLSFSLLLFFLSRFRSLARSRWVVSLLLPTLLVPYSRETCARSTMFGTFTTDKPKANLYALIP